ncbi:MAG: NifU family protein [Bacteroidia bacterium]|nr:NifU family protein [Bacteroidia bacterium]MDW8089027.1 NifU family protein [Bacteroidia bacterium]
MAIYTELTPNPHSLKFLLPPDSPAIDRGTWEFSTPSPSDPPLVQALWNIPGVERLFFTRAFVTVTKSEQADWTDLIPLIKSVLEQHLPQGRLTNPHSPPVEESESIEAQIRQILEEYVRPGIAMDGGDVELVGFSDGVVRLRLRGSCAGCPSSLFTLRAGIEALLTRLIPEVRAVEAEGL